MRVLPDRGACHASPSHHEHSGYPAHAVVGRVRDRVVRRHLRQRDHQSLTPDPLVPEALGTLRDQAGRPGGRALRAPVRDHASVCRWRHVVLRAHLPQAEVRHQVRRGGHVRSVVGVRG